MKKGEKVNLGKLGQVRTRQQIRKMEKKRQIEYEKGKHIWVLREGGETRV